MDNNIDIYNNSEIILNSKTPTKIISWITILIILSIIFLIFSSIPISRYKSYDGYIFKNKGKYYIEVLVKKSDFPVEKTKILYIKDKKYKYKILKIDKKNRVLELKLDSKIKIDNNIVKVNIKKEKTTVFKILKNKIKKGFDV